MKYFLFLLVCFNLVSSELSEKQILQSQIELLKELVPKDCIEAPAWDEFEQFEFSRLKLKPKSRSLLDFSLDYVDFEKVPLLLKLLHRLKDIRSSFETEKIEFTHFESCFDGDIYLKLEFQELLKLDDSDLTKQTLKFFISESLQKGYINERVNSLQTLAARRLGSNSRKDLSSITQLESFFQAQELSDHLRDQVFEGVINEDCFKFDIHKVIVRDSYVVYREIVGDNKITFWFEDLVNHEKINLGTGTWDKFQFIPLQNDHFAVIRKKDHPCYHSDKSDDLHEVESDDLLSGEVLRIYHKSKKCFEFNDVGHDESVGYVAYFLALRLNTGLRCNSSQYKLSSNQRYLVFRYISNIYLFDSYDGSHKSYKISLDNNVTFNIEGVSNKGDIFYRNISTDISMQPKFKMEYLEHPYVIHFDNGICEPVSQEWKKYDNTMGSNYCLDECSGVFYCNNKEQKSIIILNSKKEIKLPGELSVIHPRYVSENLIVLVFKDEVKGYNLYIKTNLCENIFNSSSFCIIGEKIFFFDSAENKFVLFNAIDNSVQELESLNSLFIGSVNDLAAKCAVKYIEKPFVYKDKQFVFFEIEIYKAGSLTKEFVLYDINLDLISILPRDAGAIYMDSMDYKLHFVEDMWHKNPTMFASIYLDDEKAVEKTGATKRTNSERDFVKRVRTSDEPSTLEETSKDDTFLDELT